MRGQRVNDELLWSGADPGKGMVENFVRTVTMVMSTVSVMAMAIHFHHAICTHHHANSTYKKFVPFL